MKEARHKTTNIVQFHLHEVPGIDKLIDTENRIMITRGVGGEGRGNGELLFSGYRDSVWHDEIGLEIVEMVTQHYEGI